MKQDKYIKWVIALGAIAITCILVFQLYWSWTNWNNKLVETDEKIRISLRKTAEAIQKYNKADYPLHELIRRQASNYYIVNIRDVIDASILEHVLFQEIKNAGLNLDFEYAIYDCEADEMQYGNYCTMDNFEDDTERGDLPKFKDFDYYFGVRFPQLHVTVISEMTLTLVLSGIMIITLLFFSLALYIILSQRRLSKLQKDFVNNMTHEFKTPISSIVIGADTILRDEKIRGDKRLSHYAKIVKEQSNKLNLQVEKILDFSLLEQERSSVKKEEIELNDYLENLCRNYQLLFGTKGGEIVLDFNAVKPVFLKADTTQFSHALNILIDNAFKYGGETPKTIVGVVVKEPNLHLSVSDEGIGIAKEERKRIMSKFYRVGNKDIHDVKGFGLGLYYLSMIIRNHRWKLNIESEVGEGTLFELMIPLKNITYVSKG